MKRAVVELHVGRPTLNCVPSHLISGALTDHVLGDFTHRGARGQAVLVVGLSRTDTKVVDLPIMEVRDQHFLARCGKAVVTTLVRNGVFRE